MKVKSKRRKIRKSRPDIVRNWTIRNEKKKHRKRSWSTKQNVTKVKATRQFKQLKIQILRFNREASSSAAGMVLMKSNKHFKPGD